MITHWDEVEGTRRERGHIAASWQSLSGASSVTAGVVRITVEPGRWATPLHLEGSEEEIFFVLSGTGVSYQGEGDAEWASAVGPGDCLVHRALEHAHTIGAGDDGLVVLAFGLRHYAANTLLPRAGVSWLGPTWVLQGAPEDHPWAREAAVGAPTLGRARRATRDDRQPRRRADARARARERQHGRPRSRRGGRHRANGRLALRDRAGKADEPAARACGRGGDLRRPRRRRHIAAVPERPRRRRASRSFRCGRETRSPGRPAPVAPTRSGRVTTG